MKIVGEYLEIYGVFHHKSCLGKIFVCDLRDKYVIGAFMSGEHGRLEFTVLEGSFESEKQARNALIVLLKKLRKRS